MPDKPIVLSLKAQPTEQGFNILAINAGVAKGHDIEFTPAVLKESLSLWDAVPCMLDHPGFFEGPSVRDLAGSLHEPAWNESEKGIQASLVPTGPAAEVIVQLREAARTDPAIMSTVGFSAVLRVTTKSDGKVAKILNISSVDCVVNPARGGRFLSAIHTGENQMEEENKVIPPLGGSEETAATQALLDAQKKAEQKKQTVDESLRSLRLQTCRTLLKVSLEGSKLPAPVQQRIEKKFAGQVDQGQPFEPADLEKAIAEEQEMISLLSAAGAIQGPGRITSMQTSADMLEAAVDDLFGTKRDARLANVKAAHLSGIRELYMMLTGDYDLHGGYYGERIQLATTADFSGLVKNALNKLINEQWDALGQAGYDWWTKIVKVQHFANLNDITGVPGWHGGILANRGRRRGIYRARHRR